MGSAVFTAGLTQASDRAKSGQEDGLRDSVIEFTILYFRFSIFAAADRAKAVK
jgi:hypothetical protein